MSEHAVRLVRLAAKGIGSSHSMKRTIRPRDLKDVGAVLAIRPRKIARSGELGFNQCLARVREEKALRAR